MTINDAKVPILDAVLIFGVVGFAMIWVPLALLFAAGFYGVTAFVVDRRAPVVSVLHESTEEPNP